MKYSRILIVLFIGAGVSLSSAFNRLWRIQENPLRITSVNASQPLHPVHLFHNNRFVGSATLEIGWEGKPLAIITAAHVVSEVPLGTYEWRLLRGDGTYAEQGRASGFKTKVIETMKPDVFADIAFCSLSGRSISPEVVTDRQWKSLSWLPNLKGQKFKFPVPVRSVASRVEAELLGAFVAENRLYYVLLYDAREHESGTGFVDEVTGALYVLNGTTGPGKGMRDDFMIPSSFRNVALVTPVRPTER